MFLFGTAEAIEHAKWERWDEMFEIFDVYPGKPTNKNKQMFFNVMKENWQLFIGWPSYSC